MADKCEHLDTCGFFLNYNGNTEAVKEGWIKIFCENKDKSEGCQRKKIRQETGKAPANNMAPTGTIL